MGFFDAFRDRPAHTQYAPQYVAFMGDTLLTGLVVGTVIVLVAFLAIARGQKSVTSAFLTIVRLSLLLLITLAILICIFDPNWKSSSVTTSSQYKAHEKREIKAEIGVGIGLRGLNVTLKGNPANQLNETINYNERFSWAWDQGRLGFGPYAGRINREFRAAQYRGLPLPIQWIVEYFTLDGEEIRWGRAHKEAGYFTNIILWTAFALWVVTLLLFRVVVPFIGAISLALTGSLLLLANIVYSVVSSSPETDLVIPIGSAMLYFAFGRSFWLTVATGIACLGLSVTFVVMHFLFPRQLASIFSRSVQEIDSDEVVEPNGSTESLVLSPSHKNEEIDIENGGSFPRDMRRRMTSAGVALRASRRKPSTLAELSTTHNYLKPSYVNFTILDKHLESQGEPVNREPLTSTSSLPAEPPLRNLKEHRPSAPSVIPLVSKAAVSHQLTVVEEDEDDLVEDSAM